MNEDYIQSCDHHEETTRNHCFAWCSFIQRKNMKIIIEKETINELHQVDNHNVQTAVIIVIDTYTEAINMMMMLLFTMIMNNDMCDTIFVSTVTTGIIPLNSAHFGRVKQSQSYY